MKLNMCPVSQFAGIFQYTGLGMLNVYVVLFMLPRMECGLPQFWPRNALPHAMTWHICLNGIKIGCRL